MVSAIEIVSLEAPCNNARQVPLRRDWAERHDPRRFGLMDLVAGIGNIYASEALHLARLSPFRAASTLATPEGAPRAACLRLVAAVKSVLRRAVRLKESDRAGRQAAPAPSPECFRPAGRRSTALCVSGDVLLKRSLIGCNPAYYTELESV
jgi:hypothetical protein